MMAELQLLFHNLYQHLLSFISSMQINESMSIIATLKSNSLKLCRSTGVRVLTQKYAMTDDDI